MNIKFENISKRFKKEVIFDGINIELESGMIHGIVGPQGCGKTTLLKIISRKAVQTSGKVLYNDNEMKHKDLSLIHIITNIVHYKRFKNALPTFRNIYKNFDVEYALDLATKFNIQDIIINATSSSGTLSAASIVIALASNEELVILDEVIVGLDIFNRTTFYEELIKKYNKDKQTFIIASSILDELQPVLNNFVLLADKEVKLAGSLDVLDKTFVLSGNKDEVLKYTDAKYITKNASGNYIEIIVFDRGNNFSNVEVRNATLLDIVESYGVKNEKN